MNPIPTLQPKPPISLARAFATMLLALSLAFVSSLAPAQVDNGDSSEIVFDDSEASPGALPTDNATRLLAQPLPEEPEARYALLKAQFHASRQINDRARHIEVAKQLVEAGRGRPGGENWIREYLNAEFTWGSSGKALEASEAFVTDKSLTIGSRALLALRQTYFAVAGNDRAILERYWSRAEDLVRQATKPGLTVPKQLMISRLQVRSEIEGRRGDLVAAVASLREAVGLARRELKAARSLSNNPQDPEVLSAYGWLDGSLGMLTYALVRQGRAPEAIELAQANIALWRAGQISDALGARWNYRLATSLNAMQQYETGLPAARLSDEMLERSGASPASQTRWLARQEVVRSLIGLQRWKEADESYREFLASMPPDTLARTRASDWRLLALLAAKNGRLDDGLAQAERMHRYRVRLYGTDHPQTREAAGVRGVIRLLRGDLRLAMSDYEALFAATLDNPAGWIDLDQRGVRGYVFGIAFDEFMRYVTEQALKGEAVATALTDRAMQIADRSSLGVTQRALTDSTARVMATTPALQNLLSQEQTQRRVVQGLFAKVNESLAQDDLLRKEAQTEAFKVLPEKDRKAQAEAQKAIREQIKVQQTEALAARSEMTAMRENIARQFPAYGDLVTPTMPNPEQLRRLLKPGEALLLIHPTESATLIWLVGAEQHNGFTTARITRPELARQVAELRGRLDLSDAPAGSEPGLPSSQLHALYRLLLAPLEKPLHGVDSLIVATDGPLASLPLAALVTAPPEPNAAPAWLVRQMAVTQLPSPSALQALRRVAQPQAADKAFMGFGDPLFKLAKGKAAAPAPKRSAQPQLLGASLPVDATRYDAEWGFRYADVPPLPETRTELQAIANALGANPKTDLVFGAKATRRAVIDAKLADRRVVAFATHGLMPGELPGVSKPSLAMAANANERESPLLELDDVLGLHLNAQWVLLSACNTAAGEKGGNAMSGLVRGFFFAGARSVLATHWAVESESAAALTINTFKDHAKGGISRGESLRQAQLAMIDGSIGKGRWSHPYYWAPYALFGDPAR